MAKEDYKGQFKSLAKRLGPGYTVKKLKGMSEKDLEKLIRLEDYMDEEIAIRKNLNKGGMMKKKGYAKGGMKKKGYAAGGALKMVEKNGKKVPFYAADGKGKMNKGGMMKKKAYAKGGKVAMYNVGGMVKSSSDLNTGIKKAPNTYK
jgi:hypothetical protein